MMKPELIDKIKRACELHGGSLMERWNDGTISAESLEKAYEEIVEKNFSESVSEPASEMASTCAIICYKMAVKNGELRKDVWRQKGKGHIHDKRRIDC